MFPYKAVSLALILFFCQYRLAKCTETQLPHPSCNTHVWRNSTSLRCTKASLELPTNFNVDDIPRHIAALALNCPQPDLNKTDTYCNVVQRNVQSFPALPQLREVGLYRFTTDTGERFPINLLLANVKHQIERIFIQYCKIGKLDAEYFAGFSALGVLNLKYNDISEIAINTFHETPVLSNLRLVENRVSSFDWTVLEPLANSLFRLHLNNQKPGLQTLTRSGSKFTLKKLLDLNLSDNRLSSLPTDILDTVDLLHNPFASNTTSSNGNSSSKTSRRESSFSFGGNPFCPSNSDCLCCEMKDFFSWMTEAKRNGTDDFRANFYYDCGSENKNISYMITAEGSRFQIGTGNRNSRGSSYGSFMFSDPPSVKSC